MQLCIDMMLSVAKKTTCILVPCLSELNLLVSFKLAVNTPSATPNMFAGSHAGTWILQDIKRSHPRPSVQAQPHADPVGSDLSGVELVSPHKLTA